MDKKDVIYIYIYISIIYITYILYIYNEILLSHEKEMLPFGKTWMDLEGIMLCEISQTEKNIHCMISLICGI